MTEQYTTEFAKSNMLNNYRLFNSTIIPINNDSYSKSYVYDFINKFVTKYNLTKINLDELVDIILKGLHGDISANDFYNFVADQCVVKTSYHPEYNKLASKILAERLHKMTTSDMLEITNILYNNLDSRGNRFPLLDNRYVDFVNKKADLINKKLDFNKDYDFDYFGLRTLERSYLMRLRSYKKVDKKIIKEDIIIERPQHLFMRVSLFIHLNNLEKAFETYDLLSNKYFTHATPTLFNAGSPRPQMSSCYLIACEDSIDSITDTLSDVMQISKWAGGIGVHISSVRGDGSIIRGTNGLSDGILGLCKGFNWASLYVNQGGKRNGSTACFVEDTEILTINEGVKKIKDVKIGDLVVTHKNRVRPVTQLHKNPLGERKIYKLNVEKTKDIFVTDNHKFWSFHTDKYKNKKKNLGWNSIEDLKNIMDAKKTKRTTCYISIPSSTNIENTQNYKIDVFDYKNIIIKDNIELIEVENNKIKTKTNAIDKLGHKKVSLSKTINRIWNLTEDFVNLIGIWLGDGHIRKTKTNGQIMGIGFTVHKDNKSEIEYIQKICIEIFGCTSTIYTPKTGNVSQIKLNSCMIGLVFNELFGSYFDGKKLPNMVFSWPKNLIDNLMAGLITTDGHITKKKCNISLGLSNQNLMNQLYHLCRSNGIDVSFVKGKAGKGMTCAPYCMSIPFRKEIIDKTKKLYNDDRIERCYKKNRESNDTYLKILEISETNRTDEYVYTLGVEEDHSYTVEGLLAENCYLEPWHSDIFQFCELRMNTGAEDKRCRDLFLALWIPDLFMERVESDEMWSLMCPDQCPNLNKVYGEEFNKLYEKYESEGKYTSRVPARKLFKHIMTCQSETGFPYMCYKDHANRKSNQKNLGTIRSSNLCAEVFQYSDENETAVCNLVSLCLPKYIEYDENNKPVYNFEKLMYVTRVAVRNLNNVIDLNFYPTEKTKISNLKNRPVGLGVQGISDVYNMMGFGFDSPEAELLNKKIFECMYYAAVDESKELAKIHGAYSSFKGSQFSEGKLQYHLWGLTEKDLLMNLDWITLCNEVKQYGTRNSLLTALMPTASTAQIMGNYEGFEPYLTNIFVRTTLAGEFIVINEHLVKDLELLNLWNEDMRKLIIIYNGSIQHIDSIPSEIKIKYKTAFEISLKSIIKQSVERGPFIDQSQSMNLFQPKPNFKVLYTAHMYGWKNGLKTGMYYLRTSPAVNPINFGIDIDDLKRLTGMSSVEELIQNSIADANIITNKRKRNDNSNSSNDNNDEEKTEEKPMVCRYVRGQAPADCLVCSS